MDELRSALELATEEELQALTEILFRPKFNPLDYLHTPDPWVVQSNSRQHWLDQLEARFRFLAADGFTVLQGKSQQVTYRQVLLGVCRHLQLPLAQGQSWSIGALEAEVFLHLLQRAWRQAPAQHRQQLQQEVRQQLSQLPQFQALTPGWQAAPVDLLLKGGSAAALTSLLRSWLLPQLARQLALQAARYEVLRQSCRQGSNLVLTQVKHRLALGLASRSLALNTAGYGLARFLLGGLGPALWTWFLADLGWRTIATNYGRVIPAVFTLAQSRLIHSLPTEGRGALLGGYL
ncbi:MAG: YaaW family protein [Nodosilinea sp.]